MTSSLFEMIGVIRGMQKINKAFICRQQRELKVMWANSSLQSICGSCNNKCEDILSSMITKKQSRTVSLFHNLLLSVLQCVNGNLLTLIIRFTENSFACIQGMDFVAGMWMLCLNAGFHLKRWNCLHFSTGL